PIGGLKEKALAALRAHINKVIIPYQNKKDLSEIPKDIRDKMTFHSVKDMDEVIALAIGRLPKKNLKRKKSKVAGDTSSIR
ncbi:MAG: hypothetical protein HKP41_19105, partial [Desulfobacterales bacterium]|nr:hypothetical protein [Desulfobacterales bacterium]